jgi:biopolymer transport protein TolQ
MTIWSMIASGTTGTKVVVAILAVFNLLSWGVIIWKLFQYARVHRQAGRFMSHFERSPRLEDAYKGILSMPESPFTRVFRKGINFYSELRPGALSGTGAGVGLSVAQLEVFRLVLEKEETEELDALGRGQPWARSSGFWERCSA